MRGQIQRPEPAGPRPGGPGTAGRSSLPSASGGRQGRCNISEKTFYWGVCTALVLGLLVRATHVLSEGFPLNDGGMFYAMVEDLKTAGYRIPAFTSYNAAQIPYGYSPLGFYVAALVTDLTGLSLADAFRLLPLLATTLAVGAFFLLARAMLASNIAVLSAVFAFALMPRSFVWLLMGGGLTRSLGFLFAILALHQAYRFYTLGTWKYAAGAALFSGLTVLSHLGTAPFVAFSFVVFLLVYGRNRRGLVGSVAIALGAIVITAPWWLSVSGQHGFEPFLSARRTGHSGIAVEDLWGYLFHSVFRLGAGSTGEALFPPPLLGPLALVGFVTALWQRSLLLPVWWLAIILLDSRAGATYATVPVAMLVGVAVADALLPLLRGLQIRRALLRGSGWPTALLLTMLGYATVTASTTHPDLVGEGRFLTVLSPSQRAAMRWVSSSTPPGSRFLVITGSFWAMDKASEWFPVLAERVSVATPQGSEWLPNDAFTTFVNMHARAQQCASADAECLERWSATEKMPFTHVYVVKPDSDDPACCEALAASLAGDPRYAVVYDAPGAVVFARRDQTASRARGWDQPRTAGPTH